MDEKQIIVIGGGLQGLATANALLDKGEKVLVLEREAGTGMETSFANAGMLTPSQAQPWNSVSEILKIISGIGKTSSPMLLKMNAIPSLFFWGLRFIRNSSKSRFNSNTDNICKLAKYSLQLTKEFRNENDLDYDHSEKGTMKIFRSESSLNKAIEEAERLKKFGIKYKVLSSKGVAEAEPGLADISDQILGGIFFPEDETGDAYKFCNELENLIREKGGRIHVNTEIKKILINKKSVNSIVTDRVELQANRVVVAAGSWSYLLLKKAGLNIPVRPVKGYSLTLDTAGLKNAPGLAIIDEDVHTALTPLGNRIRIAGTAEFAGFNDDIHEKRIDYLNDMLESVYPSLFSELNHEEGTLWYGFRPMSPDGMPYLGSTRIKGLYLNTGHGHLGWTLAMGSAAILSDLITKRDTKIDSSPYLASRVV
tara:strand:+ start:311 stop:1582 length:1272 start_codon:yes stop_codon:yes gene_type:complete